LSATTFNGALSGTATVATNLAGGGANQIPYQTAAGATSFIAAAASGVLVTSAGNVPSISSILPAVNGSAVTSLNGSNISSGTVAVARLPKATTSTLGVMQPDTNTITVDGNGIISTTIVSARVSASDAIAQRWTTLTGGSALTMTLPALSTVVSGTMYYVKSLATVACTIVANGADQIDGVTQVVIMNSNDSLQVFADTANGTWLMF